MGDIYMETLQKLTCGSLLLHCFGVRLKQFRRNQLKLP